jgi:hypothetical protein
MRDPLQISNLKSISRAGLALLLFLSSSLLLAAGASAQDVEARLYANVPVGTNFAAGLYKYSSGEIVLNSAIIEDLRGNIHILAAGYLYAFDLAGMTAKVDALVPHMWMDASALVSGRDSSRTWNGLADPKFRLTLGFVGSPALTPQEFAGYKQRTIVGASFQVIPPWGKYDSTRLMNLGSNRWTFRPEIAVSRAIRRFILECYAGAIFFTDNTDFYGGQTLTQEHVGIFQFHAIYNIRPRFWVGMDWLYATGGETRVDGVFRHDFQANNRLGATIAVPVARRHNIKFIWSSGVSTRIGGDFDNFALAYFYNW